MDGAEGDGLGRNKNGELVDNMLRNVERDCDAQLLYVVKMCKYKCIGSNGKSNVPVRAVLATFTLA